MRKKKIVTCRYGISYEVEFKGTNGEIVRGFDHCEKCCCWTCYNHDCKEPRNEILENCGHICELWTKKHYCE
jgi:hypothetical protein